MDSRIPIDPESVATVLPWRAKREAGDDDGRFPPLVDEHGEPARQRLPFPVLHIDDLQIGAEPTWLIEGLLPASGFGVVYGPPKSLKSFLLADALFHVAMGRTWAGRDVMQGAVVYVTGEGVEGFKRRLIAMRRHYAVEGHRVPFLMIPVAPDLGHACGDDVVLVDSIKAYLASIGSPPVRAVAIDTLARTMKGADENAAKDITAFVDNCERIGVALSCIVVGVHHAGKDVAKGARGSNALDGAVDVMWSVEKGEVSSTASIHHMKDGEAGASWQFRLLPVVVREGGAEVQEVRSAVAEIITLPGKSDPAAEQRRGKPLPDRPRLLLQVLRYAIDEMGETVRGDPNVPIEARALRRENLKKYLELKGYWDDLITPANNRARLSTDTKLLLVRGFVSTTPSWYWLSDGASR
ncbi:AAA family ATPase [Methylobacterium sp.]|uniref:AAA family ATPase n=1 Tax=Methylobacterium sp. TaxID=409 RepID=UPI003AFFB5E9